MLISNSNLNLVRRGANTLHISKKQPPPLGTLPHFWKFQNFQADILLNHLRALTLKNWHSKRPVP